MYDMLSYMILYDIPINIERLGYICRLQVCYTSSTVDTIWTSIGICFCPCDAPVIVNFEDSCQAFTENAHRS